MNVKKTVSRSRSILGNRTKTEAHNSVQGLQISPFALTIVEATHGGRKCQALEVNDNIREFEEDREFIHDNILVDQLNVYHYCKTIVLQWSKIRNIWKNKLIFVLKVCPRFDYWWRHLDLDPKPWQHKMDKKTRR